MWTLCLQGGYCHQVLLGKEVIVMTETEDQYEWRICAQRDLSRIWCGKNVFWHPGRRPS